MQLRTYTGLFPNENHITPKLFQVGGHNPSRPMRCSPYVLIAPHQPSEPPTLNTGLAHDYPDF